MQRATFGHIEFFFMDSAKVSGKIKNGDRYIPQDVSANRE